jgi:hypothetical protein
MGRDSDASAGANFTAYQELKKLAHRWQPDLETLPSYQHMVIGLISGAMGPFSNAPIDTIKTREHFLSRLGLSLTLYTRSSKIGCSTRAECFHSHRSYRW